MTREEAINYLRSSGLNDEQIKEIQGAFDCYRIVEIVDHHLHKYDGILDKSRMLLFVEWVTCEFAYALEWEIKEVEE